MNKTQMTVDEAIAQLTAIRRVSRHHGDTVLVLSLTGSGIEQAPIDALVLVEDAPDSAIVEVRANVGDFT